MAVTPRSWTLMVSLALFMLGRSALFVLVSSVAALPLAACSSGVGQVAAGDDGGAGDGGGGNDGAAEGDDAQAAGRGAGGAATARADGGGGGEANDGAGDLSAGNGGGAGGGAPADGGGEDQSIRDGGDDHSAVDGAHGPADALPNSITTVVIVPAAANLAGAGHAVLPPDPTGPGHEGIFPVLVELPAGNGRTLTVTNVSGMINIDAFGTFPPIGADGFPYTATPVAGFGVGGLAVPTTDHHAFLAGVFLGDAEPADPAPASYLVNATASTFNGITPRQIFFIGDGLDGTLPDTGDVQMFRVPDGATRLFLGFLDTNYADNIGAIVATVSISR